MNFKEILELIDRVAERGIGGVEIEQAGTKIRIDGKSSQPQVIHSFMNERSSEPQMLPAIPVHALSGGQQQAPNPEPEVADADAGLHIVTSPIVGTFYRSPNPESDVFINVGDRITKGKVLCIVEAMKLMNEIESDIDGVVMKIFPQNGQPIEYGEKLFAVKV